MGIKQIFIDNHLYSQKGTYTCGPCSVLNILRLKGDTRFNEEQLAELCLARPGTGTSNENLVKLATDVGLKLIDEQTDAKIQDLEKHIDAGAYVIVNYIDAFSTNGHYSVVTDYDDEALYFRDSSLGMLRLTKDIFPKYWHNSDASIHGWFAAVR